MLIAAAIISGALAHWPAAIAILVILLLNATLGAVQERRAGQALAVGTGTENGSICNQRMSGTLEDVGAESTCAA